MSDNSYGEFSLFSENLAEWDLDVAIPHVQRFFVAVDGLRQISGLRWGETAPELVFVHGGAQNAHTFDTVALALQRPLVALDLPGHGHSDPSPYGNSATASHARDVARAMEQLSDHALPLVGMSLGGLTSLLVASERPDLVTQLVLIDITPGVNADKARHITNFVNGPATFESFDDLLERTIAHNPTRSVSSLRRGILHNAIQRPDGTWVWRHQQHGPAPLEAPPVSDMWERVGSLRVPVALVRGMAPGSVVDDEDESELLRLQPGATVVHVEGAGHSIQGDQPVVLARVLEEICF
ncbi:MAG: alpha/beta hydrolase [Acidimicrobiales bacterium]